MFRVQTYTCVTNRRAFSVAALTLAVACQDMQGIRVQKSLHRTFNSLATPPQTPPPLPRGAPAPPLSRKAFFLRFI